MNVKSSIYSYQVSHIGYVFLIFPPTCPYLRFLRHSGHHALPLFLIALKLVLLTVATLHPPPNVSFHRIYTHVMGQCSQYLPFVFTSLPLLGKFVLTSLAEDKNTNITYIRSGRGRVLSNSNNELYPAKSC